MIVKNSGWFGPRIRVTVPLALLVASTLSGHGCGAGSQGAGPDGDVTCELCHQDDGLQGDSLSEIDSMEAELLFPDDSSEPDGVGAGDLADDVGPQDVGNDGTPQTDVAVASPAWLELAQLVSDTLAGFGIQVGALELRTVLAENPDAYYIIDLRGESLWSSGHIPGAVAHTMAELPELAESGALPQKKPILLVCHAGQQSAWAAAMLSFLGYDAVSLEWGMPAWNDTVGNMWVSACANDPTAAKSTQPVTPPGSHNSPFLGDQHDLNALMLDHAMGLVASFKTLTWAAVASKLQDYTILAYVSGVDYKEAHLPGAIWLDSAKPVRFEDLYPQLDSSKPVLVYDCTGQKSPAVAGGLSMLGYDAWFLKFGISSVWCSDLACAWSESKGGTNEIALDK